MAAADPGQRSPYEDSLSPAERKRLPAARAMEGLDEEIAVLRVRLMTLLKKRPEDSRLLSQAVGMLVKAVVAQYRLSPKARQDLADHVANLLNSVGTQLGLPES